LKEEYLWHHQVMFLGGQISRPGDKKQEQQTVEKRFFLVFGGENGPMSWHYEGKWGPCGQMAIIRQQDRRIWLSPLLDCHELTYLMNLGWGGVRLGAGGGRKQNKTCQICSGAYQSGTHSAALLYAKNHAGELSGHCVFSCYQPTEHLQLIPYLQVIFRNRLCWNI
jgi:hypothetical protein